MKDKDDVPAVGDWVEFNKPSCFSIAPASDEYPKAYKVVEIDSRGHCTLDTEWDSSGFIIPTYALKKVEEPKMKKEFKVGDEVYLKSSSCFFGDTHNPGSESIRGRVIELRKADWIRVIWEKSTDGVKENDYQPEDLAPWEDDSLTKLFTKDGREYKVGSTTITRSDRRKDGEWQYNIKYAGSSNNSCCVKHSDLLGLAAVLLEIS